MSDESNVVIFPKLKLRTPPTTLDEVYEIATAARLQHIDMLTEMLMDYVCIRVADEGFDITVEECEDQMHLFVETLKALLCTSVGIDHEVAEAVDAVFNEYNVVMEDEEEIN